FADRNVRSKKGSDQAPASSRYPPPAPAGGGPGRGATARTRGRQGPALKTVPRAPNGLRTEYFRRGASGARREGDNCCCQFEPEQRSDAKQIGGKTTGANRSVL